VARESFTILGIPGSLREGSFNRRLLRRAAAHAAQGVGFDVFEELGELPHYSQELEGDRAPEPVRDLRARIAGADALLVATPEYNGSMPGVLKNALDWASRPSGESVLAGKPAGVIGASPGRFGAQRAQADVRKVLNSIGAAVLDRELPVARAHEAFEESGGLSDPALERYLAAFVAALVEHAGVPLAAESAEAAYSRECQRLGRAA